MRQENGVRKGRFVKVVSQCSYQRQHIRGELLARERQAVSSRIFGSLSLDRVAVDPRGPASGDLLQVSQARQRRTDVSEGLWRLK